MGVAVLIAIGVGLAIAVQASILGSASRSVHPLTVSFALQVAGVLLGLAWVGYSRAWSSVLEVIWQWWWLPLGLIGLVVVAALGFSSARIGALQTLALVVAAQLIAALALDLFNGAIYVDIRQPAGVALVVGGVLLISAHS